MRQHNVNMNTDGKEFCRTRNGINDNDVYLRTLTHVSKQVETQRKSFNKNDKTKRKRCM